LTQIVRALACREPDQSAVHKTLDSNLRALRWGKRPGIAWLTSLLDNLALQAGVRFNTDLMLFRKSLLTLEGVLADFTESDSSRRALLDQTMLTTCLQRWIADWPQRLCMPLTFRSPSTHISTADLLSTIGSSLMTAARWWTENSLDLLVGA
jgi:hypothetical protein